MESRDIHVLYVRTPGDGPYAGLKGVRRLDEELRLKKQGGVILDKKNYLPLEHSYEIYGVWVGVATDVKSVQLLLIHTYGFVFVREGIISLEGK